MQAISKNEWVSWPNALGMCGQEGDGRLCQWVEMLQLVYDGKCLIGSEFKSVGSRGALCCYTTCAQRQSSPKVVRDPRMQYASSPSSGFRNAVVFPFTSRWCFARPQTPRDGSIVIGSWLLPTQQSPPLVAPEGKAHSTSRLRPTCPLCALHLMVFRPIPRHHDHFQGFTRRGKREPRCSCRWRLQSSNSFKRRSGGALGVHD